MNLATHRSENATLQLSMINEVLDSASIGIWRGVHTPGQHPRMCASKKMLELMGFADNPPKSEEELHDAWEARLCPESTDILKRYFDNLYACGHDEVTYKWNHPTLGVRYVRCGGFGYKDDCGNMIIEGYHSDVTEQVQRDQNENLVVSSLANLFTGIFYVDFDTDVCMSYVNNIPVLEQFIPKVGKVSEIVKSINSPDAPKLYQPQWGKAIRSFVDRDKMNKRLRYKKTYSIEFQGTLFEWARMTALVSDRHTDGTLHHVLVTVSDISEEKRQEKQRIDELKVNIDANRSKTQMLQNMSHEIRTPLNAMFGFSQLLGMPADTISDEQRTEYLNYIYNSFNMLSMLIDDVLDIADAEHGNYRIKMTTFVVNDVCRNALQMVELRCQAGVKMRFTSEVADDYTITSDFRRIEQVLVNYLTNACKHTAKGEILLHLSTTETPGHLTFSVTDTGEGIPSDLRHDIFERYRKANDSIQGSGLGLQICRTIAEKLNAKVMLDETYTDGARFLFIL